MNYKKYELVENATIIHSISSLLTSSTAVYDENEKLVNNSLRIRDSEIPTIPVRYRPAMQTDKIEEGIYIHPWNHHFGHFVLETLSRIWFAKDLPHLPLIIPAGYEPSPTITAWQQNILELLEIKNEIIFITEPTIVKKLYIPFPLASYTNYASQDFITSLAVFEGRKVESGKKLYISRSQRGRVRGYSNQLEIEEYVKNLGYTIFIPEKMPIQEVLEELASAEEILAIEGSALFNLYFIKNLQAKVKIIPRHFDKDIIFLANGLNLFYLDIHSTILKAGLFPNTNRLHADISMLGNALETNKYKSIINYAFKDEMVSDALEYQEAINKLDFPFFNDLHMAYIAKDKNEMATLISKSIKSLDLYLAKGESYHTTYTHSLVPIYGLLASYINHLRLLRRVSRSIFIISKLKYILTYYRVSLIALLTISSKKVHYQQVKENYKNILIFMKKI